MSQFVTLCGSVDEVCKTLKTKTFISQNSLDTPVFRLIRFRQKVLTEFLSLRWNYSPLKKRPPSCRVAFSFLRLVVASECKLRFHDVVAVVERVGRVLRIIC